MIDSRGNPVRRYRGVGPWHDYLFCEWGYLVLSLTAKNLLAWQVLANTLIEWLVPSACGAGARAGGAAGG